MLKLALVRKAVLPCILLLVTLLFPTCDAWAQLAWDPDNNQVNDGGAGTWDTATANWDDDAAAPNTTWTNGSNAIFGSGTYQVDLTSAGVTVGDLNYGGGGILEFRGSTASGSLADTITVNAGGATWNTGGGEIEFFNDGNDNNVLLSMTSGDTLTIGGGGTFDTGQNPQNNAFGTWSVGGANLVVTEATVVRGHTRSIGQFGSVALADGSTFVQERNSDQTFANDWVLNGDVTFGNRYNRKTFASGVISGSGRLIYKDGASHNTGFFRIDNAANTFSGGITVDAENDNTMVFLNSTSDGVLGAAPGSFDADNIILKNDGTLRSNQNLTLNANRGITLDNGGVLNVSNNRTFTIGGAIAGTGGLQIGYAAGHAGVLHLNGANASYTGETQIFEGNVRLGATNTLGQGVLNLGGTEGFARLILNDQSQTIGGLYNTGDQTKQIVNRNSATNVSSAGTLILDVADGATYTAGSATGVSASDDRGNFNIVKNGLGTQNLGNVQVGGNVAVNAGVLQVGNASGTSAFGDASVTGGRLIIAETVTGTSYSTSAGGVLQIGNAATAGSIGNTDVANSGEVNFRRSDAVTYSGVISGTGTLRLQSGIDLTLGADQTYSGETLIGEGSLIATAANQFSADSVHRIGGFNTNVSALEMNGFNQTIAGLAQNGGNTRQVQNNGASDALLTIDVGLGEEYAYNANFAGTGTVNLEKIGDGTQTFARAGAYSASLGTVAVTKGELVWNNDTSATQTGVVSVGADGVLSGNGKLGGLATIAGNLSPGTNSTDVLTFDGGLTLASTATTTLSFTDLSNFDRLANDSGDTLTAGGILALDATGYSAMVGDTFQVFENWNNYAGSFASISGTDLGSGMSFNTDNLLVDGTLTVTAVPEPATAALLVVGLGAIALRRKRNQRSNLRSC